MGYRARPSSSAQSRAAPSALSDALKDVIRGPDAAALFSFLEARVRPRAAVEEVRANLYLYGRVPAAKHACAPPSPPDEANNENASRSNRPRNARRAPRRRKDDDSDAAAEQEAARRAGLVRRRAEDEERAEAAGRRARAVEAEIRQLREEVGRASDEHAERRRAAREDARRTALTRAFAERLRREAAVLAELGGRARGDPTPPPDDPPAAVRLSVDAARRALVARLGGAADAPAPAEDPAAPEHASALALPASALVGALSAEADAEAASLLDEAAGVDVAADGAALAGGRPVQGLEERLHQMRAAHFERHLEAERALNEEAEARARLAALDGGTLEGVAHPRLRLAQRRLAGGRAALRLLLGEAARMRRERDDGQRQAEQLAESGRGVAEAERERRRTAKLVRQLVAANARARAEGPAAQEAVQRELVAGGVAPAAARAADALARARGFGTRHLAALARVRHLEPLVPAPDFGGGGMLPWWRLPAAGAPAAGLASAAGRWRAGRAAGAPWHEAPSEWPARAAALLARADRADARASEAERHLAALPAGPPRHEALAARRAEQDEETEREWAPLLAQAERQAQQCLDEAAAVRRLLDEWWTQPGQHAATRTLVDGKTVAEWAQDLRALRVQLREG